MCICVYKTELWHLYQKSCHPSSPPPPFSFALLNSSSLKRRLLCILASHISHAQTRSLGMSQDFRSPLLRCFSAAPFLPIHYAYAFFNFFPYFVLINQYPGVAFWQTLRADNLFTLTPGQKGQRTPWAAQYTLTHTHTHTQSPSMQKQISILPLKLRDELKFAPKTRGTRFPFSLFFIFFTLMCVRMFQSICECVCVLLLTFTSVAELLPCPIWGGLLFSNVSAPWSMPLNCFDASRVLSCCCVCVCDAQIYIYVCVCLCQCACVCHFRCHNERETRVLVGRLHGLPWLLASRLSPPLTVSLSFCLSVCAPTQDSFCLTCGKLSACRKAKAAFFCSLSLIRLLSPVHIPVCFFFFSGFFFACHFDALTGKFWMQNPTTFSKNKKKKQKLRQG